MRSGTPQSSDFTPQIHSTNHSAIFAFPNLADPIFPSLSHHPNPWNYHGDNKKNRPIRKKKKERKKIMRPLEEKSRHFFPFFLLFFHTPPPPPSFLTSNQDNGFVAPVQLLQSLLLLLLLKNGSSSWWSSVNFHLACPRWGLCQARQCRNPRHWHVLPQDVRLPGCPWWVFAFLFSSPLFVEKWKLWVWWNRTE